MYNIHIRYASTFHRVDSSIGLINVLGTTAMSHVLAKRVLPSQDKNSGNDNKIETKVIPKTA